MEKLDHHAVAYGDFTALGRAFHPVSAQQTIRIHRAADSDQDSDPPAGWQWVLVLSLPLVARIYTVNSNGMRKEVGKLLGGKGVTSEYTISASDGGAYTYVLIEAFSGAYITSFNVAASQVPGAVEVSVGPDKLREPNNPGLPDNPGVLPDPVLSGSPLPGDSPPVLVGAGVLKNYVVVRTQHWQKSDESYSLPAGGSLQITQTESSGTTTSSSSLKEVADSVGLTAGLGWGPVSASLSASMSRTSTSTSEVSIEDETTATVQREYSNPYTVSMVALLWQLVDRFYILTWDATYEIKAMVEQLMIPTIPRLYDGSGNPFPPPDPESYLGPHDVRAERQESL